MRKIALVGIVFALLAAVSGCSGDASNAPEVTKTVVDNRSDASGMKTSFEGGNDELEVGADIVPGTYRTGGDGCIYLVRESRGGTMITGATLIGEADVNVQIDQPGTTIESSSKCDNWRLAIS